MGITLTCDGPCPPRKHSRHAGSSWNQEAPHARTRRGFLIGKPNTVLMRLGFSLIALLNLHLLLRQCSRTGIRPSNSTPFCVRRNRWPAAPKNTEHTQSHACGVLALFSIQFSPRSLRSSLNLGCVWPRLRNKASRQFDVRLRSDSRLSVGHAPTRHSP